MLSGKITTLSLAVAFAVGATGFASAATENCTITKNKKVTKYQSDGVLAGGATCIDAFNNDAGNQGYFAQSTDPSIFGYDPQDWTLAYKKGLDKSGNVELDGDNTIVFDSFTGISTGNAASSGTWSIADFAGYSDVILVLKSSNAFAAFDLDTSIAGTIHDWSIMTREISHVSLWYAGDPDDDNNNNPPVPLPAAGWLLIGGLGGLAAMRRRKKA